MKCFQSVAMALCVTALPALLGAAVQCVYPQSFGTVEEFAASFDEGMTVYDGSAYYTTMTDALKAVHGGTDATTLWCKPSADVGTMTHGHVCRSLTVYGNGAVVSGGERDFELDTYKSVAGYNGSCTGITADLELKVYALRGVAVWGQRNTAHTLTVLLEDCENINRVYFSGTAGANNITLRRCTASGETSNSCTLYSNAPGAVCVDKCTFTGVREPINLNNKSAGHQTVSVTGCRFVACSTAAISGDAVTWAAPIRVLTSASGGSTALSVSNCRFEYADGDIRSNGDILLGDGREGQSSYPNVTLTVTNTAAQVQVQQPGDRTATVSAPSLEVSVGSSAEPTVITNMPPVAAIGETRYATLQAAIDAAGDGETVTLLADVDLGELTKPTVDTGLITVAEGQRVTLDLAGRTITSKLITDGNTYWTAHTLLNKGTLTIADSSEEGTGCIQNAYDASYSCTRTVKNEAGAALTVEGGTLRAVSGVALLNLGTCTISGEKTTLRAEREGVSGGWNNAVAAVENRSEGTLKVTGGQLESASQAALFADGSSQATISGGFLSGHPAYGAMNGDPANRVTVAGGTFSSDPTSCLATGYAVFEESGLFRVVKPEAAAEVTVTDTDSLLAALKDGTLDKPKNIVLNGDATLPEGLTTLLSTWTLFIDEGCTLTVPNGAALDLQGKIDNKGTLSVGESGFVAYPSRISGNFIAGLPEPTDGIYEVKTPMQFQALAVLLAKEGQSGITKIRLASSIELPKGVRCEPFGSVSGLEFDGQGYSVSNLTLQLGGGYYGGLFTTLEDSAVRNLTLESVSVTTDTGYVAAVVGATAGCTFENITVSGSVKASGTSYGVAAIAASVQGTTTFVGCHTTADVGGPYAYNVGSIFGTASKTTGTIGVYNCSHGGAITAKGSFGSLFGYGYLAADGILNVIGFTNTGTVNDVPNYSLSNAAGSGYTYNTEHADADYIAAQNGDGDWTVAVAVIGTTGYATLEQAVASVPESGSATIRLLRDVQCSVRIRPAAHSAIELNLDGHTVTFDYRCDFLIMDYASLTVTGTGTLQEDTPEFAPITVVSPKTDVADYSTVSIGPQVTLKGYSGIWFNPNGNPSAYGVKVTVEGKIEATEAGLYINGAVNATEGQNLPVVTLTETSEIVAQKGVGIYAAGYAVWKLAGKITALGALSVKCGSFDITGGEYRSTGTFAEPTDPNNNGSEDTGAALSITTNKNYAQKTTVRISGGTFISEHGYALYEGIAVAADGTPAADASSADITVTGGDFQGNTTGEGALASDIAITTASDRRVVSGGIFKVPVPLVYCADGYVPVTADNGRYTVTDAYTVAIPKEDGTFDLTSGTVADSIASVADGTSGILLGSREAAVNAAGAVVVTTLDKTPDAPFRTGGEAYDTAAILGGAFVKNGGKLVYDYDFGISGMSYDADGTVTLSVMLMEAGKPVSRDLPGRTLTLIRTVDGQKTETALSEVSFGEDGVFTVKSDVGDMSEGTVSFAVRVDSVSVR